MATLGDLSRDLPRLLDDLEPVQHAVGKFAKETALDTGRRDLGADMSFSGFARKVRLGAGYDLGTPVVLNLRPAGLWVLADKGRRRRGQIRPRRRSGASAILTPQGYRRSSTYGPSRGLNTLGDVDSAIERGVEQAASKGVDEMLRRGGF